MIHSTSGGRVITTLRGEAAAESASALACAPRRRTAIQARIRAPGLEGLRMTLDRITPLALPPAAPRRSRSGCAPAFEMRVGAAPVAWCQTVDVRVGLEHDVLVRDDRLPLVSAARALNSSAGREGRPSDSTRSNAVKLFTRSGQPQAKDHPPWWPLGTVHRQGLRCAQCAGNGTVCGRTSSVGAGGPLVEETFPVSRHWRPIPPSFCSACLAGKSHGSTET